MSIPSFRRTVSMRSFDVKALKLLMRNGRASWAELGHLLGLSAPSAADRVRKLEQRGVIRGYAALVDPASVGSPLTAYVSVSLASHRNRAAFLRAIDKMDQVAECHHVAGDDDYLPAPPSSSPPQRSPFASPSMLRIDGAAMRPCLLERATKASWTGLQPASDAVNVTQRKPHDQSPRK